MSKIDDYVKDHGVVPKDCLYHTNRSSKNARGEFTGKIRVLVPKADSIARCEYTCPECGHSDYIEQPWKRPFYMKCGKCGYRMGVPKMRQEFKKDAKKKNDSGD